MKTITAIDEKGNELSYKDSDGNYKIRGRKVIKEEFEAFVKSLENPLLSKIAELEKQLKELENELLNIKI